jgi:drug/metabolite transporter (DMT)-like permease
VVFAAAGAPIAIRFAQMEGVPSITIIFLRLWLTSLVLAPIVLPPRKKAFTRLARRDWLLVILAGGMHALNLTLLFFSLEFTSVLINSVMRRTSPLWMILLEIIFLHAIFTRRVWLGLLITVSGSILVGLGAANFGDAGSNPLLGGGLALINAFTSSLYLLIGRALREKLDYLPYSWLVFTGAAVFTTLLLAVTRTPVLGFSGMGYFWVLVVTLIAQLFGHIPINAALHYLPATLVSISMQLSVAVAGIFGFVFLGELPDSWQLAGSTLILAGITLATLPTRKRLRRTG